MPILKHVHKLKKHVYKKTGMEVYFCTLPDCSFKNEVPFLLGKEALCNICNNSFLITERTLRLLRPHCSNCGRKAVKGPDGKKHYVQQISTPVLAEMAADETASLKDRLSKVTQVTHVTMEPVQDEDL